MYVYWETFLVNEEFYEFNLISVDFVHEQLRTCFMNFCRTLPKHKTFMFFKCVEMGIEDQN